VTEDTASGAAEQKSLKRRFGKWLAIALVAAVALFMLYRFAGTSVHRATVQRVYEEDSVYRVEYVETDGTVHVAQNSEIIFPNFKLDTADVHAELNRLADTKDIVDLKLWGFRFSWFSVFPNVVDIEFVKSSGERRRQQAERLADVVVARLTERGVLKPGDAVREELVRALEAALAEPPAVTPVKK
jgi:hypothetical protein